jgi:hypothetical protein
VLDYCGRLPHRQCVLHWHGNAINEIGGFQMYPPTSMDYDFWLRIGIAHPIVLMPEVMIF